ncbi:MAG: c-type cytochrome [Pseudomonadota bacterium]
MNFSRIRFLALPVLFTLPLISVSASLAGASETRTTIVEDTNNLPDMDPERGKHLFADRGCVVCHTVNNVGGHTAAPMDATSLSQTTDPFDFFARMWRGADQMLALQNHNLGYQVDFSGQDLADIFAFVHDREAQENFTEGDLPQHIRDIIDNMPR